jgi:CRP-like cAMP-binding protein
MPLHTLPDLSSNRLLRAWPDAERRRLQAQLAWTALPLGQVLSAPGVPLTHVHFPTTSIVSLLSVMEDGGSMEATAVGPEGVVGVSAFLGGGAEPGRSVVHTAGLALRLPAPALAEAFTRSPGVARLLLLYTQTLLAQMAQTAACTRHHSLDQQLCRWLLLSLDRLRDQEIVMTHERIAQLLGVRREGVTTGALRLQSAGLIRYRRGRISVLDRPGIEQRSCECYAAMTAMCRPPLPDPTMPVAAAMQ